MDRAFRYVGKFDFTIRDVAKGERYIFVDAKGRKVDRMFIAQFEAILRESSETYNYSFRDAAEMGGMKFRQNTYAISDRANRQENPQNEGALTADFLTKKGYTIKDELMASRYVTVPDAELKHELILFYIENIGTTGQSLSQFYNGDNSTPLWVEISKGLSERALKHFEILA